MNQQSTVDDVHKINFAKLQSEIQSYVDSNWSSGKQLKKLLATAPLSSKYVLLLNMKAKSDNSLAVHVAASKRDTFHHSVLLKCMLDGLTAQHKCNLLEQQNVPYGNNVLHLLVSKNSSEVINMIVYLLDGLNIEQQQRLVYMKNKGGETVFDRAHNRASSAISNFVLQTVSEPPVEHVMAVPVLQQQPYVVLVANMPPAGNGLAPPVGKEVAANAWPPQNYRPSLVNNPLEGNRMVPGAEAPPSYETLLVEQSMSEVVTNPAQRANNSTAVGAAKSLEALGGGEQRFAELEARAISYRRDVLDWREKTLSKPKWRRV